MVGTHSWPLRYHRGPLPRGATGGDSPELTPNESIHIYVNRILLCWNSLLPPAVSSRLPAAGPPAPWCDGRGLP